MVPEFEAEGSPRPRYATAVLGSADREPTTTDYLVTVLVEGLRGDISALEGEVTQLRQAIATRAPIEQAKGILMLRYGVDADRAFAVLLRVSSTTNLKVRAVATVIVGLASGKPAGGEITGKVLRALEVETPGDQA